jgi:glycosyltransferase involved in cell wall biosynthesis
MRKNGELLHALHPNINVIDLKVNRLRSVITPIASNLKKIMPDIVLSAMWPLTSMTVFAWLLSGRKGKLFLSDHVILSLDAINNINVKLPILKIILIITYNFSNGIIAVSKGVKSDLCYLGNFHKDKVRVIYNPAAIGEPTKKYDTRFVDKIWGHGPEKRILSVGTLKKEKDYETLIKAVAILSHNEKIKLIILGDGPERKYLEKTISDLDLTETVLLYGFTSNPYPWYASADLFVLSSLWEGFGNVIVESLESGTPVVSTDCPGGVREILDNGRYGTLVEVGNEVLLSYAIDKSLKQSHDLDALKRRSQDFSISTISDQYMEYFLEK